MKGRHVLPIRQLLRQLLSSSLLGQSTGFPGSRQGFLHRLPPPFDMYVHLHDVQIQWDQPAGSGDPLQLQCPLHHQGKQSLTANVCMLCTAAQGHAVSPAPVRTSFSEKGINYKGLLEPSKGDSWQLITLGCTWMK